MSSTKKSGSNFVLISMMNLCHLCFAVACDCGLMYFRRNKISKTSSVCLLLASMSLNV